MAPRKYIPQTTYERIHAVIDGLMKLMADGKRIGATEEDLNYYKAMINMLQSASDEAKNIDAFIQHYKVLQRMFQYQGEIILRLELQIADLSEQLEKIKK